MSAPDDDDDEPEPLDFTPGGGSRVDVDDQTLARDLWRLSKYTVDDIEPAVAPEPEPDDEPDEPDDDFAARRALIAARHRALLRR